MCAYPAAIQPDCRNVENRIEVEPDYLALLDRRSRKIMFVDCVANIGLIFLHSRPAMRHGDLHWCWVQSRAEGPARAAKINAVRSPSWQGSVQEYCSNNQVPHIYKSHSIYLSC